MHAVHADEQDVHRLIVSREGGRCAERTYQCGDRERDRAASDVTSFHL
jgi:hypothetical protein